MEQFSIERLKKGTATVALGNPCRVICTDLKSNTPVVVAIEYPTGEKLRCFDQNGYCAEANLRLVTEEPQPTAPAPVASKPKPKTKK